MDSTIIKTDWFLNVKIKYSSSSSRATVLTNYPLALKASDWLKTPEPGQLLM